MSKQSLSRSLYIILLLGKSKQNFKNQFGFPLDSDKHSSLIRVVVKNVKVLRHKLQSEVNRPTICFDENE